MGDYTAPKQVVIMDLDGTLANIEHRLHYIREPKLPQYIPGAEIPIPPWKPDWNAFHDACIHDILIEEIYALNQLIYFGGREIHIVSGRMDHVRDKTEEWLKRHHVFYHALHMRKSGDYRPDYEIKKEIYDEHLADRNVLFAVDDRNQVVKMWRSLGIRTLQVADGDY